jgi:eukaryotic-like serine/threonine-protein kinase
LSEAHDSRLGRNTPDTTLPTVSEKGPRATPVADVPAPLDFQRGNVLGKYRLGERLGAGGMGTVFEAVHIEIGKAVALKILSRELAADTRSRARFLREALAASRLMHPHVVNVTDVGEEGEIPFLVMELLRGEDLAAFIARHPGGLFIEDAIDIMLPVAAGVFAAHEAGVIHRDLKPRNIFLARTKTKDIEPKVLDFGISKVDGSAGSVLTASGALLGTVPYLAPEHIKGAPTDARSDQYTLGVVLAEALTGRHPHDGPSAYAHMQNIAEGRFYAPTELRPDLPEELEEQILRAMATDPGDRFSSVYEFGRALLPFASPKARVIWAEYFGRRSLEAPLVAPGHTAPTPGPTEGPVFPAADPFASDLTFASEPYFPTERFLEAQPAPVNAKRPDTTKDQASRRRRPFPATMMDPAHQSPAAAPPYRSSRRHSGFRGWLILATLVLLGVLAFRLRNSQILVNPLDLIAGRPAPAPGPATTRSLAPRAPAPPSPAPPTPTPSKEITLAVRGAPAGTVARIGGSPARLPVRLPRSQEPRAITFEAPGFEPMAVTIVPTGDIELPLRLRPLSPPPPDGTPDPPAPAPPEAVTIAISSVPSGAAVRFDGERSARGKTPISVKLPPSNDTREITVQLRGYQTRTVPLVPSADRSVTVRLSKVVTGGPALAPKTEVPEVIDAEWERRLGD